MGPCPEPLSDGISTLNCRSCSCCASTCMDSGHARGVLVPFSLVPHAELTLSLGEKYPCAVALVYSTGSTLFREPRSCPCISTRLIPPRGRTRGHPQPQRRFAMRPREQQALEISVTCSLHGGDEGAGLQARRIASFTIKGFDGARRVYQFSPSTSSVSSHLSFPQFSPCTGCIGSFDSFLHPN